MEYVIYYYKPHRAWYGYWATKELVQVGEAVNAATKEECLIELGRVHGDRLEVLKEMSE